MRRESDDMGSCRKRGWDSIRGFSAETLIARCQPALAREHSVTFHQILHLLQRGRILHRRQVTRVSPSQWAWIARRNNLPERVFGSTVTKRTRAAGHRPDGSVGGSAGGPGTSGRPLVCGAPFGRGGRAERHSVPNTPPLRRGQPYQLLEAAVELDSIESS
jgi:hypothetical protein